MFWDIVIASVVLSVLVVLVMGPAMWSSDTDPLVFRMWRAVFGRKKKP